jgi:hypothetical protein
MFKYKLVRILRQRLFQNILEVVFYILCDVLGHSILEPICSNCSLEEIVSSVLGTIGLKAILVLLPYLALSFLIYYLLKKRISSERIFSFVNLLVNLIIVLSFISLPKNTYDEMFWPTLVIITSSLIIILWSEIFKVRRLGLKY